MTLKVLLVDDSKIVRKVTRKMLEALDFDIHEVENGQEAVDFCAADMPGLILLDYNMPIMNGMECLQAVRALPGGDKPIIIFCTTVNEMDFILRAMQAGANEYVMKPFDNDILLSKLEQVGLLPPG